MLEGASFPVFSLAFSQFLESDLLFDSLVALKEVPRADELLQIFGFNTVGKAESLNFRFADDGFSRDFEDAFRLLGRVVDRLNCLRVLSEFPSLTALLIVVLPLVDVEQRVLAVGVLDREGLRMLLPCGELG